MRTGILYIFFFLSLSQIRAQSGMYDTIKLPQMIIMGDTMPEIILDPVEINATRLGPVTISYRDQYYLRVVYPYALRISRLCQKLNQDLEKCKNGKQKRKYLNTTEKLLKDQFSKELKNLTVTQGKFLVKLVYRETGRSVFDLLKEYRGGFKTFFWVIGFKIWKIDLKDTYEPEGKDKELENYVVRLDEIYQRDGTKYLIENEKFNIGVPGQKRKGDGSSDE
jgi:Domain of unknown function (DUF4294)